MLCHVTPHVSGPCAACGGVAHPAHIFGTPEAPALVCAVCCGCEKQSESKGSNAKPSVRNKSIR